jgi:cbb3-type cytochrome oxidase subunit 3
MKKASKKTRNALKTPTAPVLQPAMVLATIVIAVLLAYSATNYFGMTGRAVIGELVIGVSSFLFSSDGTTATAMFSSPVTPSDTVIHVFSPYYCINQTTPTAVQVPVCVFNGSSDLSFNMTWDYATLRMVVLSFMAKYNARVNVSEQHYWNATTQNGTVIVPNTPIPLIIPTPSPSPTPTPTPTAAPTQPPGGGPGGGGGGGGYGPVSVPLPEKIDFEVSPDIVSTMLAQGQKKTFFIRIKNTGVRKISVSTELRKILKTDSDDFDVFASTSENSFELAVGETRVIELNLVALGDQKIGTYIGRLVFTGAGVARPVNVVVEVIERKPLFDAKVSVLPGYKTVYAGNKIVALVSLENVGLRGKTVDVALQMLVMDFDRKVLFQSSEEVFAVETLLSTTEELEVPAYAPVGKYVLIAKVRYDNATTESYDTFEVVEKLAGAAEIAAGVEERISQALSSLGLVPWSLLLLALIALAIAVAVLWLYRKVRRAEAQISARGEALEDLNEKLADAAKEKNALLRDIASLEFKIARMESKAGKAVAGEKERSRELVSRLASVQRELKKALAKAEAREQAMLKKIKSIRGR